MSNFIPNTEIYCLPDSTQPSSSGSTEGREPIRLILIGSMAGINLIIAILHRLGFAEPRSWSKPQTDPVTGQPMRVLTKWIRHS
jgi:hypothetical protein